MATRLRRAEEFPAAPARRRGPWAGTAAAWVIALVLYYRGILFTTELWTGRDLPDVGFLVALLFGAAILLRVSPRGLARAASTRGVAGWLALVAWGTITLAWSPNPSYGGTKLATVVCFGVVPGALLVFRGRATETKWWPVVLGGVLFALLVWTSGEYVEDRLSVAGGNPIWIARACLMAVAVAIWAPKVDRWLRLSAVASCAFVAIATGSRGPLLAFVAAPLLYAASRFVSGGMGGIPVRRLLLLGGAAAVAVAAVTAFSPGMADAPLARVMTLFAPPRSFSEDAAVAERMALQRIAAENFADHPIAGVGAGGNAAPGTVAYPHNIALEVASELGLVGLIALVYLVAVAAVTVRRNRLTAILFWQALIYAFTSGDLGSNELLVMFACVGASAASLTPDRAQDP